MAAPQYKILVTGSRHWPPKLFQPLAAKLLEVTKGPLSEGKKLLFLNGQCPPRNKSGFIINWNDASLQDSSLYGADWQCHVVCSHFGWKEKFFPANWFDNGLRAGQVRNRTMVLKKPDIAIAFILNDIDCNGTLGCVKIAEGKNVKVEPLYGNLYD